MCEYSYIYIHVALFWLYYIAALNEASPQHNVVLKKLEALTERLQRAKEVETLLQKFKMEEWIAEGAAATANELVLLALDRIKNQVTDYDVFIRMLKSMPGVKPIADQMMGMCIHNMYSVCGGIFYLYCTTADHTSALLSTFV